VIEAHDVVISTVTLKFPILTTPEAVGTIFVLQLSASLQFAVVPPPSQVCALIKLIEKKQTKNKSKTFCINGWVCNYQKIETIYFSLKGGTGVKFNGFYDL
jgi:hypothetical protein